MRFIFLMAVIIFATNSQIQNFESNNPRFINSAFNSSAPCFSLYSDNSSTNGDDIIRIKVTRISTGTSQTWDTNTIVIPGQAFLGNFGLCDYYNIEITVSVGGNCSVGIQMNGGSTILACHDVCCGDGQTITFNNIYLSSPFGIPWNIFLKEGSC
jgi:hypothetical protein